MVMVFRNAEDLQKYLDEELESEFDHYLNIIDCAFLGISKSGGSDSVKAEAFKKIQLSLAKYREEHGRGKLPEMPPITFGLI